MFCTLDKINAPFMQAGSTGGKMGYLMVVARF
jgi:hypothetical protein